MGPTLNQLNEAFGAEIRPTENQKLFINSKTNTTYDCSDPLVQVYLMQKVTDCIEIDNNPTPLSTLFRSINQENFHTDFVKNETIKNQMQLSALKLLSTHDAYLQNPTCMNTLANYTEAQKNFEAQIYRAKAKAWTKASDTLEAFFKHFIWYTLKYAFIGAFIGALIGSAALGLPFLAGAFTSPGRSGLICIDGHCIPGTIPEGSKPPEGFSDLWYVGFVIGSVIGGFIGLCFGVSQGIKAANDIVLKNDFIENPRSSLVVGALNFFKAIDSDKGIDNSQMVHSL